MLISFTGEVTESKAALAGGSWIVRLKDIDGELVSIHCKHPTLIDAGKMLVIGQMVEVLGMGKRSTSATTIIPFGLFAKNGLKAADFNRLTNEYLMSLLSGEDAKAKATIETQKQSLQRLQMTLDAAQLDYQNSQRKLKDSEEEALRLRKSLEETDRELQYERTVNGALT
jgi:hypothetical protein